MIVAVVLLIPAVMGIVFFMLKRNCGKPTVLYSIQTNDAEVDSDDEDIEA